MGFYPFDIPNNPLAWPQVGQAVQNQFLKSAVELMVLPLEIAQKAMQSPISMSRTPTLPTLAETMTARLSDPNTSFTRAVETAEPLFDMLSDEDV